VSRAQTLLLLQLPRLDPCSCLPLSLSSSFPVLFHFCRLLFLVLWGDTWPGQLRAGELVNVLREAGQAVPEDLLEFGTAVKKKVLVGGTS